MKYQTNGNLPTEIVVTCLQKSFLRGFENIHSYMWGFLVSLTKDSHDLHVLYNTLRQSLERAFILLGISKRAQKNLASVLSYLLVYGKYLTVKEIANATRIEVSNCYKYLKRLVDYGLVGYEPRTNFDKNRGSRRYYAKSPTNVVSFFKSRVLSFLDEIERTLLPLEEVYEIPNISGVFNKEDLIPIIAREIENAKHTIKIAVKDFSELDRFKESLSIAMSKGVNLKVMYGKNSNSNKIENFLLNEHIQIKRRDIRYTFIIIDEKLVFSCSGNRYKVDVDPPTCSVFRKQFKALWGE